MLALSSQRRLTQDNACGIMNITKDESGDLMLLSDIQQVVTPKVWESLQDGQSYHFNVTTDFFVEGVENYYDHYWLRLRDGRRVVVPRAKEYTDFCERLLIVWAEYLGDGVEVKAVPLTEVYEIEITEDEHWYCRNCGKDFSHSMNFRRDGFNRRVCPVCESRKIEKVRGALDDFYD